MIHKVCKECRWENYPLCDGTIIDDIKMNIEKLDINFICGTKEMESPNIFSRMPQKSLQELKIEQLEARILALEAK